MSEEFQVGLVDPADFAIDEARLHKEWFRQSQLYMWYGLQSVDAKKGERDAKVKLDLTYANLELDIRGAPEAYNLTKVTDASIKSAILAHPDYKTAVDAYHQARHLVDTFDVALTSLDHKKYALQSLVSLHGANYFSAPKAPEGAALPKVAVAGIEAEVMKAKRKPKESGG